MEIKKLGKCDGTKWDEFVLRQDNSTIFHLSYWRTIIENTYNYKAYYLYSEKNDEIKGILPLFSIKSKLFGNKMISMPFAWCGGACSNSDFVTRKLIEEATEIARDLDSDYLELRNLSPDPNALANNTSFVTSILKLKPDPNEFYKLLPKGKREDIRRAKKRGNFVAVWNDDIKNFYRVYAQIMKDLGTPLHSIKFFTNILEAFPNNSKILSVQRDGELIGSYLLLNYKDTMIAHTGGSISTYKSYYPGDFCFWTAIEYACRNGFEYFDFARSTMGSSSHIFKQKYNSNTVQIYYQYYLNKSAIPSYDLLKPRHQMFVKIWQNIPIKISKSIGPALRKFIP